MAGIARISHYLNKMLYAIIASLTILSFSKTVHPVNLTFSAVQLLQCKTVNFLSPELWLRNSPELNSTDYEI